MAEHNGKVVINLATGLEDAERVTVAFLVGGAAASSGRDHRRRASSIKTGLGSSPGDRNGRCCGGA